MNKMKVILKGTSFPSHLQGKEVEIEITAIDIPGLTLDEASHWEVAEKGFEMEIAPPPKDAGLSLVNVLGATPKRVEINF